jgi:mannose-6-phosphate isomerase-like protein (cupin superfamily)
MSQPPPASGPRLVVTGLDDHEQSTVVSDGEATARLERPGGATIVELWRADRLPAAMGDVAPLAQDAVLPPAVGGVGVRICTFPPDSAVDAEAAGAYAASLADAYGDGRMPGMHQTETVDVITVLSGELHVVLEAGEAVLGPGDSLVQRGTQHAWSNRTSTTTTVLAVMMSATRDVSP